MATAKENYKRPRIENYEEAIGTDCNATILLTGAVRTVFSSFQVTISFVYLTTRTFLVNESVNSALSVSVNTCLFKHLQQFFLCRLLFQPSTMTPVPEIIDLTDDTFNDDDESDSSNSLEGKRLRVQH